MRASTLFLLLHKAEHMGQVLARLAGQEIAKRNL